MSRNQSSKIPRRARTVPVEFGELWGSILSSTTSRMTEIDGLKRITDGDEIAATNNKIYDAECLMCSVCARRLHYLQFNRDSRLTWRRSRRYECKVCEKLQGVDQSARRKKRHARSKIVAA